MGKNKLTIGILGGMGPAATVDLYKKIISYTPAERDQDHIRIFIDNNPQIPDRTDALNNGGADPVPFMLDSARKLENARVDFIIIPCNTAHAFVPRFANELHIPILSMVEVCVDYVLAQHSGIKKVGLLATTGTVSSNIYADEFKKHDVSVITPGKEFQQDKVMAAIYGENGIKAGNTSGLPHALLVEAARQLEQEGAEVILMACTEIPLALHADDIQIPLLDPTDLLAQAAVKKALGINL
jgi:aspartate racemase